MYNEEELSIFRPPCQFIEGKFIPCTVVISHLEALAKINELKKKILDYKVISTIATEIINLSKAKLEEDILAERELQKKLKNAILAIKK